MTGRIVKPGCPAKSRSRGGCASCKEKRLKCDETKPACTNCLKRKLLCPGYQQVFKWKAKCQTSAQHFPARKGKKANTRANCNEVESRDGITIIESASGDQLCDRLEAASFSQGQSRVTNETSSASAQDGIDESIYLEDRRLVADKQIEEIENVYTNISPDLRLDSSPAFDWSFNTENEYYKEPQFYSNSKDNSLSLFLEHLSTPSEILAWRQTSRFVSRESSAVQASDAKRKGIRQLLNSFYGLSSAVYLPLVHQETKLVEYYFSTISGIYSCFDSHLNPFRFFVGQMWAFSPSMYYTIQSMAAAHLANGISSMRKLGLDLHRQASQQLHQELSTCYAQDPRNEHVLLVLLLIGLTSSWHRASDLGLPYLRIARSIMHTHPVFNEINALQSAGPLQQMFEEAMVYWEMMISFVADESEVDVIPFKQSDDAQGAASSADIQGPIPYMSSEEVSPMAEILPHPWTGISPQAQMLLAQVGRLVRRVRTPRNKTSRKVAEVHHLSTALNLEENLLGILSTTSPWTVQSGDFYTKTSDFVALAEATRDCGLLELYRTFPCLLRRRFESSVAHDLPDSPGNIYHQPLSSEDFTSPSSTRGMAEERQDYRSWRSSFAIHILKRLESIPDTSNIRCHQLLLLLIAAAELRLPQHQYNEAVTQQLLYDFCDMDLEISRARGFARARLNQLAVQLPAQPVRVMLQLLEEVWTRIDFASTADDEDDVFWVDVMIEKGWHTVMG